MPWTNITIPNQGGATWWKTIKTVIDNLAYLFGISESVADTALPNPSFDVDTDGNNIPDEWTWTPYNGGTQTLDATDSIHGGKSLKITQPSGAGNGGGFLETTDYFAVSAKRTLELQWTHYCTAAGQHDLVEIRWFDKDKIFISTGTVYDSTSNPTAWRIQGGNAAPPATARFAKLRITGGKNDTNISSISRWDDFKFQEGSSRASRTQRVFTSTQTWTAPNHITRVQARLWGGGAGAENGINGGGGGGGEYVEAVITVVPGEDYTLTIGAGGAAGAAGGDTSFVRVSNGATILSAMGGTAGTSPAGGAGGSGGSEQAASLQGQSLRINGQRGRNAVTGIGGGVGGAGGDSSSGGGGGAGTAGTGTTGIEPGGGGGGGLSAGGAGAKGRIALEY